MEQMTKMVKHPRIYLDLDGVLADFDAEAEKLFGMNPRKYEEHHGTGKFWSMLDSQPNFYRNLPLMHDAKELVEGVTKYAVPTVLTGAPSSNFDVVSQHKREWVAEQFPDLDVIVCFSRHKSRYCGTGDILIDDWNKYMHLWQLAGGTFILHTSAKKSLEELALAIQNR